MPKCSIVCVGGTHYVRRAVVKLGFGKLRFSARLGGVYRTTLHGPGGKIDDEIDETALTREDRIDIGWENADFYGHHWFLGDVRVGLDPERATEGSVLPLAATDSDLASETFYPARNTNRFFFHISIPRFNLELESDEPVENSAVIESIPPLGIDYPLAQHVVFRSLSWPHLTLTLIECVVRMMSQEKLGLSILETRIDPKKVRLTVEFRNLSERRSVVAVWFFTTQDGIWPAVRVGQVRVGKRPRRVRISLPRDLVAGVGPAAICAGTTWPDELDGVASDTVHIES